jgi:hypothetical protein
MLAARAVRLSAPTLVNETFGSRTLPKTARALRLNENRSHSMSTFTLLFTAFGVSADAFAVALGKGSQIRRGVLEHAIAIGLLFGAFQAVMPLIGWYAGVTFETWITAFDHWVAFTLLVLLGVKMLYEAFHTDDRHAKQQRSEWADRLLLASRRASTHSPSESLSRFSGSTSCLHASSSAS